MIYNTYFGEVCENFLWGRRFLCDTNHIAEMVIDNEHNLSLDSLLSPSKIRIANSIEISMFHWWTNLQKVLMGGIVDES